MFSKYFFHIKSLIIIILPYWENSAPPRSYRLPNNRPCARGAGTLLKSLVRSILKNRPQHIQIIQTIGIVFGCQTEIDSKALLLKPPHTLTIGHRKIKLVLTKKLPPY